MQNLATALWSQGDLVAARKLEEEILDIRRRVLGPEHPRTVTSMNNLAESLRALGDLPAARKLQEEALAIRYKMLGPEHPSTSTSAMNLFETLMQLNDFEAATMVLKQHLLWLLDSEPAALSARQREVRNLVVRFIQTGRNVQM
jgi:hypothetical protein